MFDYTHLFRRIATIDKSALLDAGNSMLDPRCSMLDDGCMIECGRQLSAGDWKAQIVY
jgi:hypothetical protein